MKTDLYQQVTDRVIALMQQHGAAWINPMSRAGSSYAPRNPTTGKAYRGINVLLLSCSAFTSNQWAGFSQWKAKGCNVKKGSKATTIVYWKIIRKRQLVEGVERESTLPLLRYLNVFNLDQVEGEYADKARGAETSAPTSLVDACASADELVKACGAVIRQDAEARAYYSPIGDFVHMPNREVFAATSTSSATENFYSTLLHELTHWTGHSSRLSRDFSGRFGSDAYAAEELVAELGAAFLCAELGISPTPRADHAAYLNSWLRVLRNDPKAIVTAASKAKAAAAFLTQSLDDSDSEEEGEEVAPIAEAA